MEKKYRLGLVALHPVPYQVPFYRALARHPAIDPFVIYLDDITLRGAYDPEFRGVFRTDASILDGYRHAFTTNLSPWTNMPIIGRVNPGVISEIVKARFDAVLISGYHHMSAVLAATAAKSVGTKVLLRAEADLTNPSRSILTRIKTIILPTFLRQSDAVMYSSRRNRDYFLHYGVPSERLFPILSSVDNDTLAAMRPALFANRSSLRATYGIPENAIVFLYVGRLTDRKRVLDPLLAMRNVMKSRDDVWLVYVGDGPLRQTLKNVANAEGIAHRVVLAGFQNPADVPRFFAASDVFVLPSGYDPTPKALNEAMVFKLPTLVSDGVGTAGDLVRNDENGLVYRAGDLHGLEKNIQRLANDGALRARLGEAGSISVADWSPEANAAGVLAALRYCLGAEPGSKRVTVKKTVHLAHLLSHPIQYKSPLLRRIAQEPDIDLTVFYRTDFSVGTFVAPGFDIPIRLNDVDLLGGYRHYFLPAIGSRAQATFWRPVNYGQGRRLRAGNYDAIWVHGYGSLYSLWVIGRAKMMGLKVLLTDEAHLRSRVRRGLGEWRARLMFLYLRRCVDMFLAIGRANADYYRYRGVPENKIFRMPFAVDGAAFAPKQPESRAEAKRQILSNLGIAEQRTIILYASKLTTRKRCADLIHALSRLDREEIRPRPLLLIAGDGIERPKLESLVSSLGLGNDVRFLGFRTQTELPQLYQASDVFVLPSHGEPVGYVILEAMNAGCAIVASEEIGAAQDLVVDGVNGYVFPAGDVGALTDKLALLLSDVEQLERFSAASRRIISDWNFDADVVGLRQALGLPEKADRSVSTQHEPKTP